MGHPRAYAYIQRNIAHDHALRYELELRDLARRSGYDLARTIVEDEPGRGARQLLDLISHPDADDETTVLLPALAHAPVGLDVLGEHANVDTMVPDRRWQRLRRR